MNCTIKAVLLSLVLMTTFGYQTAFASSPDQILEEYSHEAKKTDKSFHGFSAERGKKFYLAELKNKKGETVSCSGCHTKDPTKTGKTRAGKAVEPIAISANKERFTDKAKVEKWFKRNCNDVYERACTTQEKGDFIAFMKSVK